jgi:uncharacterized protein (DUF2147 family)
VNEYSLHYIFKEITMKKLLIVLFCAFVVSGICFAADPVEGFWLSIDEKTGKTTAGWEIYQENGVLFGRILSVAGFPADVKASNCDESYKGFPVRGKVNEMTVVGTSWIFGLTLGRNGQWSGGNVIDPNEGKMYKCRITFRKADGKKYAVDTLEMRGEIGLGIGRSQFWTKGTKEQASALR